MTVETELAAVNSEIDALQQQIETARDRQRELAIKRNDLEQRLQRQNAAVAKRAES